MNSGLERELTPCVKECGGHRKGPRERTVRWKTKAEMCLGVGRMGLRSIFKICVYQEKGSKDMEAIRKGWYFSCKKENINTCNGKRLAGNMSKCEWWMFWGVDYE